MDFFEYSNFDYRNWHRPEHKVIKDDTLRATIYKQGYAVIEKFIDQQVIDQILSFYENNHSIEAKNGGMFVSIYSKDLSYRLNIHNELSKKLGTLIDQIFDGHKSNGYNFIVKYPGTRSEMFLHQDMPFVDEMRYSEVGVWLPLQAVREENGCMGIIPNTHFSIPPTRSLHNELPYSSIYESLTEHIVPLCLNAGDLLLYDPRLVHNSFQNKSAKPRIAIATRMSPAEADYIITYKDENDPSGQFEQIKVEDDFFLTFDDFISGKIKRPTGQLLGHVKIKDNLVDRKEFLEFCKITGIQKHVRAITNGPHLDSVSITEPRHQENKTKFSFRNLVSNLIKFK